MRAPVNDAPMIDDQHLRRCWGLMPLPAAWQQLLTEQNVFRALTLIVFCSIVFSLLFYCHFLPFGTDNNETFSSILHAKNMYLHGIGTTYGLTSETTSPIDAVQFVYTHQGNFPRFYALLLYTLGARSAEAQILITTLTIGLASILFAHIYMERRVSALFAFIFCSVLITDYVMSLQWLVNTWRVWHFFFFFSTLLLAHAFAESAGRRSKTVLNCGLLLINFACLFYFELIFAMFIAIFFGLYLAFLLWRQPARLMLGLAVSGIGSVLAISLLLIQIILYLGWQDFLSDLYYTFFSRNAAPTELPAFRELVIAFMREHNIVFWDNFTSANSGLKTSGEMLRLFFRYNLITQTPMLVLLSLLLTAGAWLHAAATAPRIGTNPRLHLDVGPWMRRAIQPDSAAALLIPAFVLFGLVVILSGTSYGITDNRDDVIAGSSIRFMSVSLVIFSAAVLIVAVFRNLIIQVYRRLVLTAPTCAQLFQRAGAAKVPAVCLLVVVAFSSVLQLYSLGSFGLPRISPVTVLLLAMTGGAAALWLISSCCTLTNGRVVLATGFLVVFAAFAHYHAWLYQPIHYDVAPNHFESFWSEVIAKRGGPTFWKVTILATAFLSTAVILGVMDQPKSPGGLSILGRIAPYWLIGMASYAIAFTIASGYIHTGYQVHHAPFAVYFSVLPGVCAVYVLWSLARPLPDQVMQAYRTVAPGRILLVSGQAILSCGILAVIAVTWITVQSTYVRRIPPDRVALLFRALKTISGASTVVSTYATPVAIVTGQWSYFDPIFFHQRESFDGNRYYVSPQDFRYLWFGDWKSNSAYQTPAYFVCWLHLNFFDVVSPAARWSCGDSLAGVRNVRKGLSIFDHKEVFRDQKNDLWSVIKLDWDYPPYLRALDESSPAVKVRVAFVSHADGIAFAVETDPVQQEGRPIAGAHYRLYVETGDDARCDLAPRRMIQSAERPTELSLPKNFQGCAQIGVVPFTATKSGSEYYSSVMTIGAQDAAVGARPGGTAAPFKRGPK
jgi:hypothetical protein